MNDLQVARFAAREGAAVVRRWFGHGAAVEYKRDVDPVTTADRESEQRIIEVLREHRPGDEILAEEQGGTALGSGRRWIVDPLDGTVNFVHGVPHVAVSVGLHHGSEPVVGVIVDVIRDEEFAATAGGGATLNGAPITVSDRNLQEALIATGFPYDRRERAATYGRVIGEVLRHVQGLRRMGTASLDLAWVAAGRYDAFWELGLAPWDVAAGLLIVREAGGMVTDREGEPSLATDSHFIASNGSFHEQWRSIIDNALPA